MEIAVSEISFRYEQRVFLTESPTIRSSQDAETIFRRRWQIGTMSMYESSYILFLNRANKVKGINLLSVGGMSGTVVDAKQIFARALATMSASVILAHNHPSGNLQPSGADISLTKKLVEAGKVMDLPLLDHLILSPYDGYYSFADEGRI